MNGEHERRPVGPLIRSIVVQARQLHPRVRFHKPYTYTMELGSDGCSGTKLSIKQAPFSAEGFASTVWDSSIVMAKHFEERGRGWAAGQRCLDLSAGCGLPGIVLARLGAHVTATDLPQNLALLRHNTGVNVGIGSVPIRVLEQCWGSDTAALEPPFGVVVACDVMYIDDAVLPLLHTLKAVSGPQTQIYLAHGRNRQAEATFMREALRAFTVEEVPDVELHDVFQTVDVTVLRLKKRACPTHELNKIADQT